MINTDDIVFWNNVVDYNQNFRISKVKKLSINMYIYLLFIYKYILLKDFIIKNYKFFINLYKVNLYYDIKECRLYYLFYYLLIISNIFCFINYIYNFGYLKTNNNNIKQMSLTKRDLYMSNKIIIKNSFIFIYNNNIFIIIILLCKYFIWLIYFSKYKYYFNINQLKKIFFFNEFILKIEYNIFFLYKKYIEYFRMVKYNEYLSNNILLDNYPKLNLFLRYSISKLSINISFRKNFIFFPYIVYKLNISKELFIFNKININFNKYKLFYLYNEQNSLKILRGFLPFIFNNLKIENEFIYLKIMHLNIFKFLNFVNPSLYFKCINLFKVLMFIYLSYISYEVYHKYILLHYKLRRIICKHIISLHWKYNNLKFKFINYFYKFMYRYKIFQKINNNFLLNYGFLSFYYLENNFFFCDFLKKNILLYRIYHLILIKWYYSIFDYFYIDINVSPHKDKNFSNSNIQKIWLLDYLKHLKLNSTISPLSFNFCDKNSKLSLKSSYYGNNLINISNVQINLWFTFLWNIFYKISIVYFLDIYSYNINKFSIYNLFINYKYSLEFIFWEIINSNNNKYLFYKRFLCFDYFISNIKKDNILSFYLTKYYNSIINYILQFSKDFFINMCFFYSFFCDFFFRIIIKKKITFNLINIVSKKENNIYYQNSILFSKFFFYLTTKYLNFIRYNLNYNKCSIFYNEYTFNFSGVYIDKLKEVIKEFKFINIIN